MTLQVDGKPCEVSAATFELFHLFSLRPDWILDVACSGAVPRLRITGTTATPALPGPAALQVAYVDAPRGLVVAAALHVIRIDVARVRVEGSLRTRDHAIELALEAALVT